MNQSLMDAAYTKFYEQRRALVEALPKAVPHIGLETDISAIKDEWKIHKVEKDSNLPTFYSDRRSDHYWRSVFKIKTVNKNKSTLSYRPD